MAVEKFDRLWPWAILCLAIGVQAVRVFFGLDFTDEMQYYGEILGLLESGRLFSSDFFVQQLVYAMFYPIFRGAYSVLGQDSIVLVGRSLFALIISTVIIHAYRRLSAYSGNRIAAAIAAFLLALAIPYHNIYAISYNTIAQVCLVAYFLIWLDWDARIRASTVVRIPLLLAGLGIAHPVLGIVASATFFLRLSSASNTRRLLVRSLVASAAVACFMVATGPFFIDSLNSLADALSLSRAFGIGGVLIQSGAEITIQLSLALGFAAALLILRGKPPAFAGRLGHGKIIWLGLFPGIAFLLIQSLLSPTRNWFLLPADISLIMAFCAALLLRSPDERRQAGRLILLGLVIGITVSITSSNGIYQFSAAAMILSPLLYVHMVASLRNSEPDSAVARNFQGTIGFTLSLFFAAHYLWHPYLDARIWELSEQDTDVPAFRHILISKGKIDGIREMQHALGNIPPRSTMLVIGPNPWIYFVAQAVPDTGMIFMHFSGAARAYELLGRKMSSKKPEYLVMTSGAPEPIVAATSSILSHARYDCSSRELDKAVVENLNPQLRFGINSKLILCKLAP